MMDINSFSCLDCHESHWKQNMVGDLVMCSAATSLRQMFQMLEDLIGPHIWDVSKSNKQF